MTLFVDKTHPDQARPDKSRSDNDGSHKIPLRLAYIMSRFPKLTETFVMNEILAMKQEVEAVEIFPLLKEKAAVVHDQAARLAQEAHYTPFASLAIVRANLRALRRQRAVYMRTLRDVVRETRRNRRFLLAELALFPKAVYLASLFQERGIQHIHAHFATHPAAAAFIIHRFTSIPYSFTAHGSDLHRFQDMLCLKIQEAAFVVTISQYNRRFILDHCGEHAAGKIYADKTRVIHCGVDLSEFDGAGRALREAPLHQSLTPIPNLQSQPLRAADAAQGDTVHLLCIGTLHEVKGQRYLLQAVTQLIKEGLPVECHFVGDGPDRPELEALAAQLGIAPQVTFHGLRSRSQVLEHLRQAHILVAPSVPASDGRREGIPVVLVEGMAAGVPVVASRLSGIPELVRDGETGLLAAPGAPQELAAAVRRLIADPELARRLSQRARAYVASHFNLQQNAAALAQLFLASASGALAAGAAPARVNQASQSATTPEAAHGPAAP